MKILMIMLLIGGAFCSADLAAQSSLTRGESDWHDFEYVKQSDAWLTSENAAGLQYLPVDRISFAEVYFDKNNGRFVNYYQSNDSYEFGARTESFLRLNPRIVFYGKVNYGNFKGKNMGGSVFINPDYNAIDIVEFTENNQGTKNIENYNLTGAVGINLTRKWAVGGKIDYRTANYAKFKDLRHFNKLLDLSATVGFSYKFNETLEFGANYFYRRSVEGLEFELKGNTDRQYASLISFGSFYGRTELFGGTTGYTEKDNNNPVFNEFNGASLQVNLKLTGKLRFFNEFSYRSRKGYYGKRTPSSPVYTEHSSDIKSYSGALVFENKRYRHFLKINADDESLENFENIYNRENSAGGSSDIVYYGNSKVFGKEEFNANIEYKFNPATADYNPPWILKAGADYHNQQRTTSLYPYYRKQTIRFSDVYISVNKNIINKMNKYDFSIGILYGSGGGTAKNDGAYVIPTDSQREPRSLDKSLYHEYEYLTAARVNGNIGLGYSRRLKSGIRGYVRINYGLTNAFKISYIEKKIANLAILTAGCNF
ncbi:MAG: hypothetical protein LBT50_05230 [Prevotellaceae bacterium]|nr:hypothetical protein [Prevotellaceae bacterium]